MLFYMLDASVLMVNEGSGIYVTPALVLRTTNSVGVSLLLWLLGALFGLCGVLVWLELGLSVPKFRLSDHSLEPTTDGEGPLESVPRNGGEKNYVYVPGFAQMRLLNLLTLNIARVHL